MGNEALLNGIAKQDWVEPVADALQQLVHGAFPGDGGRQVKNFLHGTWLGHALHPVLTDVPVGAWTVALVLDALEGISGRKELGAGADAAVGLGLLGAVGAAITGLTDFSDTDGRGKRLGVVHGLLNVVAASAYTGSYFMRKRRSTRQQGIALSMLGYAIASASAYLGGHLVFGEQIGVDHTATQDNTKPETFTAVMKDADLAADKPTRAMAGNVAVCLVRRGGEIFAITDTCPHLGGPLSQGKLVGDAIQCPWHQSELALDDGHVVNGPAVYPARCFDVRVVDGNIEVRSANKQIEGQ